MFIVTGNHVFKEKHSLNSVQSSFKSYLNNIRLILMRSKNMYTVKKFFSHVPLKGIYGGGVLAASIHLYLGQLSQPPPPRLPEYRRLKNIDEIKTTEKSQFFILLQ